MKQRITVLGSTGSIGTSTLDVLARHPEQFSVYALTASSQVDLMLAQCAQFKPQIAVMVREDAGRLLADRVKAEGLPVEVRWGAQALDEVSCAPEVDAVMAAIEKVLDPKSGAPKTPDIGGNASTADVGRAIAAAL